MFDLKARRYPRNESAELRRRGEMLADPLPGLLVEAERVANTVAFGIHGRRRVGQGETFWQFRHYRDGDPRTAIDWRKSAKSPGHEALYVRDNEWEAAQSVYLYADRSPSMAYQSTTALPTKADAGTVLILALALLLVRAGERIAGLGSGAPPATGRAAYNRFAHEILEAPDLKESDSIGLPPDQKLPAHARVVMVSDFLHPLADIRSYLDGLTGQGVTGHLLQINDPSEEEFPFSGRTQFDAPHGQSHVTFGRAENLKAEYRQTFLAHRQALSDRTARTGWQFATHRTDHPPEASLLALYLDLSGGFIDRDRS